MDGLTGRIKFDTRGFRSDFDLEIIELKKEGLYRLKLFYTFLMGLFFSMVFWLYRNIWLVITIHFAINFYDKLIENESNSPNPLSPFMLILPITLMVITLLFNSKKLKNQFFKI